MKGCAFYDKKQNYNKKMSLNCVIIIVVLLSISVIGNYGFHLYYNNKRKQIFNKIGDTKYIQIKGIETEISAKNKFSWQLYMADIILFDDKLLILFRNYFFHKFINMNLAVIQISKNEYAQKLNGVKKVYFLETKDCIGTKIKIKANPLLLIKSSLEINLDFKNRLEELKVVNKFIEEELK